MTIVVLSTLVITFGTIKERTIAHCIRRTKHMWNKYDYLCTDCDALTEVTTLKNLDDYRGWCSCGSPNLTQINKQNATV